jgi:phosphoribosylformylglycinamidine synthase PurS subunit
LRFKAKVTVRLKEEIMDPEGETVKRSLVDLNFPVSSTKLARIYELELEAKTKKDAETLAQLMCSKLLVNPVKDSYELSVEGENVEHGNSVPDKQAS